MSPGSIGGLARSERALMCRVCLSTGFPRVTSAQVMVFDLLGVRTNNELAPFGVAWLLALEAGIIGQLVLSRNTAWSLNIPLPFRQIFD